MKRLTFYSLIVATLLIVSICSFKNSTLASYQLANEEVIYSFKNTKGKLMTICQDKNENYLIYRFGSSEKIELEFPIKKDASSWKQFEYSYFFRGGGTENDGLDLNYLTFTNEGVKYVIYNTYHAEGELLETGIKIFDLVNKKRFDVIGDIQTIEGSLSNLRINDKIKIGNDLY